MNRERKINIDKLSKEEVERLSKIVGDKIRNIIDNGINELHDKFQDSEIRIVFKSSIEPRKDGFKIKKPRKYSGDKKIQL